MQGSELRAIRKTLGLTLAGMAQKLGLSEKFVGMMERGQAPIEERTAVAVEALIGGPLRVTVGTFEDRYVLIVVEAHPQLAARVHRVLRGYDTLDAAIDAAIAFKRQHGCEYLPTALDYARLVERKLSLDA